MKVIVIPSLNKYQHYKDRNIIWIKLYVDILHDYKFQQLKDNERWIWIGLIILAVKNDNEIPADFAYIAREVCHFASRSGENGARMVRKSFRTPRGLSNAILKMVNLKLIAIKRIAKRKQDAIPDKIRENKRREEDNPLNKFYKNGKDILKEKMKFK